jgi:hypothetical protein
MYTRPQWVKPYQKIPYVDGGRTMEGADCWGLLRLIMLREKGIELPLYAELAYEHGKRSHEIGQFMSEHTEGWQEIDIKQVRAFDGLWIRMRGEGIHVALAISEREMIHTEEGADVVITDFRDYRWNRRILKAYRHERLV